MICNCGQDIKYHDLKRLGDDLVCPICFHVHHTVKSDAKEKFVAIRGIKMPFEKIMDDILPAGKLTCIKGCGQEVRRDGIMCGSCRGKVAMEAKRAKRKEIIMSGKIPMVTSAARPDPEQGAHFDEPLPPLAEPTSVPYQLPPELQEFRDNAVARSVKLELLTPPDPIVEITEWRRKAALWDTYVDRINAIFTDLGILKSEIERSV